eukprot:12290899-Karenia_brevis.AAC.1
MLQNKYRTLTNAQLHGLSTNSENNAHAHSLSKYVVPDLFNIWANSRTLKTNSLTHNADPGGLP